MAEIMKLTGVGAGTFQQAVKEGFVTRTKDKRYALASTMRGLIRYLDKNQGVLPIYDNVDQCSSVTGIPASLIKAARKKDKAAFKNNLVHLGPLLRQLFANEATQDWVQHKQKWDAIQSEAKGKELIDETLNKEEASRCIKRGVSAFFFAYDRMAEIELPTQLKGLDEAGIREGLVAAGKTIKGTIADELRRFWNEETELRKTA